MARSFGRILASIWDDEDFRALTPTARLIYVFLVSQPDLDHAGVIPLRSHRWGRALALPASDVDVCLKELAETRFIVVDEGEEELLVRSLIRRDEIWRQPNVFKASAASAVATKSTAIKRVLLREVRRLDLAGASREIHRIRDVLITHLEPFANPSPTPPEPSSAPSLGEEPGVPVDSEPDTTDDTGNVAGQNPSRSLRQPLPTGTSELRGKGSSYGPVPLDSPFPFPPPPGHRPAPGESVPLWPAAVPEEGEDSAQNRAALVADIRAIRPDWSTASINRTLRAQAVAERPWPLVRAAALEVARDPASEHPGRLAHDGPWWRPRDGSSPDATGAQPKPPWCGYCNPDTRMLGEDHPGRCPACHPYAKRDSA
jgi:hypothetical protein